MALLDILLQNGDDQISQEENRGDIGTIQDINIQYLDEVCEELVFICPASTGGGGRILIS